MIVAINLEVPPDTRVPPTPLFFSEAMTRILLALIDKAEDDEYYAENGPPPVLCYMCPSFDWNARKAERQSLCIKHGDELDRREHLLALGFGMTLSYRLAEAGYESAEAVLQATDEQLMQMRHVGPGRARWLRERARGAIPGAS